MNPSPIQFVRAKLNEPGVSIAQVAESTGVSVRSLQMLKSGESENAWATRIDLLAEHFGYRFEAVPLPASAARPS
jgi:transcriptional regulator with XRE-family HTH domain